MTASVGAVALEPVSRPADRPDGSSSTASIEAALTAALTEVLDLERVPAESDFFDDLGADSMTMARFCARVRKRDDLPAVSIKDVYRHPTIQSLAAALAGTGWTAGAGTFGASATAAAAPLRASTSDLGSSSSTLEYVLCAAAQALAAFGYLGLVAVGMALGIGWVAAAPGLVDIYVRTVVFGAAAFVTLSIVPIAAKWILIGRWEAGEIRVWSAAYVRFWIVRTLVQRNPMLLFVGSPLYVLYLRVLGARIGRDVVILSSRVPVCTDLLTVGDATVIRKDVLLPCYQAADGVIRSGPITLGQGAVVGEAAVLDIATSIGDGAQLGHASSLQEGQSVPAGERRAGFGAQQPTDMDYGDVDPIAGSTARRAAFSVVQVATLILLTIPFAVGVAGLFGMAIAPLGAAFGHGPGALTSVSFYVDTAIASLALFGGSLLAVLVIAMTVPRVLALAIEPDRTYGLYGFHYAVHRAISRLTNLPFFTHLFGDSSYIVHYLRGLGYDLPRVVQTGTNFGLEVKHETPFLATVGSGTVVADGLSIINADYSSTSFRVSRASIPPQSFLGNYVIYPAQATVGEDLLLATKVLVPVDGATRESTGLLGSPSFEIPRSVQRDRHFDRMAEGDELRRRLAAKDRHNLVTMGLFLLVQWLFAFGAFVIGAAAVNLSPSTGIWVFAAVPALVLVWSVAFFVLVERSSIAYGTLRPRYCSIYDPYFWWHERYWKLATQPRLLDGTAFKGLVWRLLGVRVGRRLFDDGARIVEKTLVTIGDDCMLGAWSILQAHSQEDGTFKSDRITIGSGCSVGMNALVHYGVRMGDGSALAADAFLMKGEEVPVGGRWAGNPARDVQGIDLVATPERAGTCR